MNIFFFDGMKTNILKSYKVIHAAHLNLGKENLADILEP